MTILSADGFMYKFINTVCNADVASSGVAQHFGVHIDVI